MVSITNGDLFETWVSINKEKKEAVATKIMFLLEIDTNNCPESIEQEINRISQFFCLTAKKKWEQCSRTRSSFLKKNGVWLKLNFSVPENIKLFIMKNHNFPSTASRGRPKKDFENSTTQTKKKRVKYLLENWSPNELNFAAKISANKSEQSTSHNKCLSVQQALALCLDLDLSESKYLILSSTLNSLYPGLFPSLYKLKQYKKTIIPSNIITTEISAEVNLQDLLNATTKSIMQTIPQDSFKDVSNSFTLISKWGFDGSSGHSMYKQKFTDTESTDAYLMLTAFVPLRLIDNIDRKEVWENSRPSSTMYCRPIRFKYIKECKDVVKSEEQIITSYIEELQPWEIYKNQEKIVVRYEMLFTMLDGSAINTLSGTNATQNCFICGATPKLMNNIDIMGGNLHTDNYKYGLSSLHCWIRSFETLLHVSYKLPFKLWQVRGEENKAKLLLRKREIQEKFKTKMGLLIDVPKPGYGTTNDGNTARRFFDDPKLSSEITGINEQLISNLGLVLRIVASGKQIDMNKFDILTKQTRDLYLEHYNWYYMPSTLHKLLIHGKDIISYFDLPIGHLSEEALEARHKEIRKNRLSHTRKTSRLHSNQDLMNILLLTSDPLISSLRKTMTKRARKTNDINFYLIDSELTEKHSMDHTELSSDSES